MLGSRRALIVLGIVALVLALESEAKMMPFTVHGDGYYTYLWARSAVFDGDFDFANDYRICGDPWNLSHSPIGENVNYWNLGPGLFWAPILAWDRLTYAAALDDPNLQIRNACRGELAEGAVRGSLIAGLLTLWLGYLVARRHAGEGPAIFGMAAIGLLSSLPYYAAVLLSYGHAASSFGCALAIWAWDRARGKSTTARWAVLGACLGLAMLMRAQNAVLVVPMLGTWLVQAYRLAARGVRPLFLHVARGILFTLLMLLVFLPQLDYWHSQTGSWLVLSQGEHYMRWTEPRIMGVLFSEGAGLFTWQPITYLACAGMVALTTRRATRALGIALLTLFALDTYTVASVYDWWASIGFPGRRFDLLILPEIVGCAALGAAILRAARTRPRLVPSLLASFTIVVLGVWNLGVEAGIATAMRVDRPVPSDVRWNETFGHISTPVSNFVGNPLAWPASIPFALRYRVHPRQWDVVGGPELFYHDHQTLVRRPEESIVRFDDATQSHYLVDFNENGLSVGGMRVRGPSGPQSRILLPLHWGVVGSFALRGIALSDSPTWVSLRDGDVRLGTQRLPNVATTLRFAVPSGGSHPGINELWLWVSGGPVAFETLEILDTDPPPSARQRERNREVTAARAAYRRFVAHSQ